MSVRRARWIAIMVPVLAASATWSAPPELDRIRVSLEAARPDSVTSLDARRGSVGLVRVAPHAGSVPLAAAARRPSTQSAFMRDYLLPQISKRLGRSASVVRAPAFTVQPDASAWRRELQTSIEHDAERAVKRAVRRWAVDRIDVEIPLRGRGRTEEQTAARPPAATRFGLGIARLTPRLIIDRPFGTSTVRGTIDLRGRLGFDWRGGGAATLRAGVDARHGRFDLAVATSF